MLSETACHRNENQAMVVVRYTRLVNGPVVVLNLPAVGGTMKTCILRDSAGPAVGVGLSKKLRPNAVPLSGMRFWKYL